ncbi:transposase [Lactobacillus colini]|uniref:Transposase n=2 Tax=Lactobacillus colini TaxID=1819254 RepID=A0ABS4MH16_9LACO|nr:IS110 family transposase [Lactobacillus colini]MBP2059003.1 transposase [Lactobacillus colini]
MSFQIVFGVDVSSHTSNVSVVIKKKEQASFKITNDKPGFEELSSYLELYSKKNLVVVLEATGVYSLSLEKFLSDNEYNFIYLNPLKAKKLMDNNLRHLKTDKVDAKHLAMIEFTLPQPLSQMPNKHYREMKIASHTYDQLTHDLIIFKTRLHRALQTTFPQIEKLFGSATGIKYWQIIQIYPHAQMVLDDGNGKILEKLKALSGIGQQTAENIACRLKNLATKTSYYDDKDSEQVWEIRYCVERLLDIQRTRQRVIEKIKKEILLSKQDTRIFKIFISVPGIAELTAARLIAEFGDLSRFKSSNQMDAYIGIDPGRYQSGQIDSHYGISKHGSAILRKILYETVNTMITVQRHSPCHVIDYYERKKRLSQSNHGYKKIAIASVHKLIRLLFALIHNKQTYDYNFAVKNE